MSGNANHLKINHSFSSRNGFFVILLLLSGNVFNVGIKQAADVIMSMRRTHEHLLREHRQLQRRHTILRHRLRKSCYVLLWNFVFVCTTASVQFCHLSTPVLYRRTVYLKCCHSFVINKKSLVGH